LSMTYNSQVCYIPILFIVFWSSMKLVSKIVILVFLFNAASLA
jgi:hypothetical protein